MTKLLTSLFALLLLLPLSAAQAASTGSGKAAPLFVIDSFMPGYDDYVTAEAGNEFLDILDFYSDTFAAAGYQDSATDKLRLRLDFDSGAPRVTTDLHIHTRPSGCVLGASFAPPPFVDCFDIDGAGTPAPVVLDPFIMGPPAGFDDDGWRSNGTHAVVGGAEYFVIGTSFIAMDVLATPLPPFFFTPFVGKAQISVMAIATGAKVNAFSLAAFNFLGLLITEQTYVLEKGGEDILVVTRGKPTAVPGKIVVTTQQFHLLTGALITTRSVTVSGHIF